MVVTNQWMEEGGTRRAGGEGGDGGKREGSIRGPKRVKFPQLAAALALSCSWRTNYSTSLAQFAVRNAQGRRLSRLFIISSPLARITVLETGPSTRPVNSATSDVTCWSSIGREPCRPALGVQSGYTELFAARRKVDRALYSMVPEICYDW